jgi:uncharacterized phosphosugar-binding protein
MRSQLSLLSRYIESVQSILEQVLTTEIKKLETASQWIADAIMNNHKIFVSNISHALSTEVYKRAGGFVGVVPLISFDYDNPMAADNVEDSINEMINKMKWKPAQGDVVIIALNAGTHDSVVKTAEICKKRGARVIGISSIEFETAPNIIVQNADKKILSQVVDLAIDLKCSVGDGGIRIPEYDFPICPTSGVISIELVWAIFAGAVEIMLKHHKKPLIYKAVQLPGGNEYFTVLNNHFEKTGIGYERS